MIVPNKRRFRVTQQFRGATHNLHAVLCHKSGQNNILLMPRVSMMRLKGHDTHEHVVMKEPPGVARRTILWLNVIACNERLRLLWGNHTACSVSGKESCVEYAELPRKIAFNLRPSCVPFIFEDGEQPNAGCLTSLMFVDVGFA